LQQSKGRAQKHLKKGQLWIEMNDYFKEYFDYKTFATVALLTAIGLLCVYSATHTAGLAENFTKQLVWTGMGFLAMFIVILLPIRFFQVTAYPLYALSLLVLILVPFLGKATSGSTSWFAIGSIRIQPSEFVKVTTVLALSNFLSTRNVDVKNFHHLAIAALLVLLPFGLIMLQPDLGTGIVFLAMFIAMVYWAGLPLFIVFMIVSPVLVAIGVLTGDWWGTALVLGVIGAIGISLFLFRESVFLSTLAFGINIATGMFVDFVYRKLPMYQQKRISAFFNPLEDPLGSGYNVLQAKVAVGSGGLFGKGFLQGTQTQLRFIPKQWTDFIFCVPGEEFGFVGGVIVILLLGFLLHRGIKIATSVVTRFSSSLAIGITAIWGFHIFINIGMTLGLMPVIGIPLPFLSYGGSFLLTNMVMAGMLINLYANRKQH
jgi:rod shape determining protein RodA